MGGFFPSPPKGGGASPSRSFGTRDLQGLMAVTVKMVIEQAADGEANCMRFHGGSEASLVELVGQVEACEMDQMFMKYVLDDGTGRLTCKRFVDPEKLRRGMDEGKIPVGKFVRIVGLFRRFGSDNFVTAHRVEEIRNLDEIARHRIEVVHTFVQLSGGNGAVSAGSAQASTDYSVSSEVGSSQWFLSELQRVFGPRGPKYNPNSGVSRQALHMHFLNQMPAKLVDEKIQSLHDEGHMFSTIDDNHFQLTFA